MAAEVGVLGEVRGKVSGVLGREGKLFLPPQKGKVGGLVREWRLFYLRANGWAGWLIRVGWLVRVGSNFNLITILIISELVQPAR